VNESQLLRLADRLRQAPASRLARRARDGVTFAEQARSFAQLLADAALGVAERSSSTEPQWRTVPKLPDFAVADQVQVTGLDLFAAATDVDAEASVWMPAGRTTLGAVLAEVDAAFMATRDA
jgi:hypothetical protein